MESTEKLLKETLSTLKGVVSKLEGEVSVIDTLNAPVSGDHSGGEEIAQSSKSKAKKAATEKK